MDYYWAGTWRECESTKLTAAK